ncbi:MAG: hypothetical protein A2603_05160 [Bdellovibrionales bacterium RIFOXYD1_FULL_55_31]|nr:MAG: hypothetical protein A2603_05160 [Bdellovibrionales bacterium RIFOXYD1_FULL_55_31]
MKPSVYALMFAFVIVTTSVFAEEQVTVPSAVEQNEVQTTDEVKNAGVSTQVHERNRIRKQEHKTELMQKKQDKLKAKMERKRERLMDKMEKKNEKMKEKMERRSERLNGAESGSGSGRR